MNIKVIKSNRRSISIEITPDCDVIVRVNRFTSRREIESFLDDREDWINRTVKQMQEKKLQMEKEKRTALNDAQIRDLAKKAKEIIPDRVDHYAQIIGVDYGRITIRNQRTRWGSCSAKHNLNFNCLLLRAPEEILDYVIVHELCHIRHMDHSKAFWNEVGGILPDYKNRRKWLKDYGDRLYYSDSEIPGYPIII